MPDRQLRDIHEHDRIHLRIACLGFTSMVIQILLVREAGVWLRGNELIITALVAAWLVWIAAGTAICYLWHLRAQWVRRGWWLSVVSGSVILITLRFIGLWRGGMAGETFSISSALQLAAVISCVPCIFSGIAFGAAVRTCEKMKRDAHVTRLYVWETCGALIAGVTMTFLFLPLLSWWVCVWCPVALVIWDAVSSKWRSAGKIYVVFVGVCITIFAVYYFQDECDLVARLCASRFVTGHICADYDLPRMRMTIIENDGEANFYYNGRFTGSSIAPKRAEECAAYISLAAEEKQRICLIGFPYNGIIRQLNELGWKRIDVIEPVVGITERIAPFLEPADYNALTQKNVRIVHMDPRVFMRKQKRKGTDTYDAVFQDVGVPDAYSTARMYTHDWYSDVNNMLNSNGVFFINLPGSPGYVPDTLAQLLVRVQEGMCTVFSNVVCVPASSTFIVGDKCGEVRDTPEWWQKRWENMKGKSSLLWFSDMLITDNLNEFRRGQFARARKVVDDTRVPTDISPYMYADALRYEEERYGGILLDFLNYIFAMPFRVLAVIAIILFLWGMSSWLSVEYSWNRIYAWLGMSAISTAGFLAEMTVILRFSFVQGPVFYAIGLVFAAFMTGLVAGTIMMRNIMKKDVRNKYVNLSAICAAVALVVIVYSSIYAFWPNGQWIACAWSGMLTACAGVCVGMCFAFFAVRAEKAERSGAIVYAADLLGAVFGGALLSFLIVPIGGFNAAAYLLPLLLIGVVISMWRTVYVD